MGKVEVSTSTGEFEIVEEDVDGVRRRCFANAPASLAAIWERTEGHGEATYLVYEDERYSYARTRDMVTTWARYLMDVVGVKKGDRVAIAMRNYPEWVVSFWASATVGAVVVPLNAWWTAAELTYALTHSKASVLFADEERLTALAPHVRDLDLRLLVACRAGGRHAGAVDFGDIVSADAPRLGPPSVELGPDDEAMIMYTSGTTGRPKGAITTHGNVGAHVMNGLWAQAAAGASGRQPPSTLMTFPLFHVGGLNSFLVPHAVSGGKVVLMHKWDVAKALDLVEREGITAMAGVPMSLGQLLDEAARQGRPLTSLAGVASGGSFVPPDLVQRINDQLESRASPVTGYGLTETTGAVTANGGRRYMRRPDSAGRPVSPVMQMQVVDPDGKPLATGEIGEIWLRGPTIFRGYLDDPEATNAALVDGWLRTGDLGRIDDEGFLFVVDRLKDVIIRGGENVYAAEVEAALHEHAEVLDAAVVGVPDPVYGESVAAVVVLRPGATVAADDLQAHVAARLAAFKVPSVIRTTFEDLPRNATGKVLKRELRPQFTGPPG